MDLAYAERAVYLPAADALVAADLHVGRDERSGVALPLGERERLEGALADRLDAFDPAEVVLAGDLLDGPPVRGVRETVAALADLVAPRRLTVTPGNHDAALGDVLDGVAGVRTTAVREFDGVAVCHGHELPDTDADAVVLGHEHPAVEVEGRRWPCFLRGPGRGAEVVVLPAFSPLAPGTDLGSSAEALSPMVTDLDALRPVVLADGDPLEFPRLGELRPRL